MLSVFLSTLYSCCLLPFCSRFPTFSFFLLFVGFKTEQLCLLLCSPLVICFPLLWESHPPCRSFRSSTSEASNQSSFSVRSFLPAHFRRRTPYFPVHPVSKHFPVHFFSETKASQDFTCFPFPCTVTRYPCRGSRVYSPSEHDSSSYIIDADCITYCSAQSTHFPKRVVSVVLD